MEFYNIAVNIFVCALLIGGLGLNILALPGNTFLFIVALVYGFYEGFVHINTTILAALLGAVVLGELIELVAGALGAKKEKASKRAIVSAVVGAILGGIVGTTVLPVLGSIFGAIGGSFIASYLAEYSKQADLDKARRVARSVMSGQILGMIIKLIVGIGMVITIFLNLSWS
ncbi:hypothetical protein P22_2342 [Propionispora sp. 2/2-37]|uniref:DUF456 domain-containing protein n=1 Tax=Propionispora sp. 2/2-37 TaxID=1677858 RepID=UPI0006BB6363|nr:DUF456 domain-containing protein [Propionispora sp. 2/2-37]CUH96252.1 hypothetical protein P22_2342 [Propionispora sp. 2/2-37]